MKKSHVTKKRTAKQIAATKKLVAFNRRSNKKSQKRYSAAKKKDHLWIIFLCRGRSVSFVNFGTKSSFGFTSDKGKAALFQTKTEAIRIAESAANSKRGKTGFVGIANANTTPAEIKKSCRVPIVKK